MAYESREDRLPWLRIGRMVGSLASICPDPKMVTPETIPKSLDAPLGPEAAPSHLPHFICALSADGTRARALEAFGLVATSLPLRWALGGAHSPPVLGHPGLRKAVGLVWPHALVQRCCVHKLRNLERKAPKHALAEIRADFHRIVYAESVAAARAAYAAFERKWTSRCPGVVRSLQEGGDELLTFFQFPKRQ